MYRIFLVEDDGVIAGAIADGLTRWGFEPYICNDFQNVTEEFLACDPHLTLLDISLPFYRSTISPAKQKKTMLLTKACRRFMTLPNQKGLR